MKLNCAILLIYYKLKIGSKELNDFKGSPETIWMLFTKQKYF